MPNRRRFIQASLAVSAASLLARSAWANVDASSPGALLRPQRFIIDDRYQAAIAAASVALVNDIEVMRFAGDPTSVWYHGLDRQWRVQPMVLAGLTLDSGLFVLETLASDHGMRVWYHASHYSDATRETTHTVLRSGAGPDRRALKAAEHEWPGLLGRRLCGLSVRYAGADSGGVRRMSGTHLNDERTLHSWVIGPRAPVRHASARPGAAAGDLVS